MANLYKITKILNEKNIPVAEFCKENNMSVSGFKRIIGKNSTRLQSLEVIAEALNCPVGVFFNDERITTEKKKKDVMKPHIPLSAQAGSLSGFAAGITSDHCELHHAINAFGNYNYTIEVRGDSMLPDFNSGDVVACKSIQADDSIWNDRIYVIDTNDGVVMKKLRKIKNDQEHFECISLNSE